MAEGLTVREGRARGIVRWLTSQLSCTKHKTEVRKVGKLPICFVTVQVVIVGTSLDDGVAGVGMGHVRGDVDRSRWRGR